LHDIILLDLGEQRAQPVRHLRCFERIVLLAWTAQVTKLGTEFIPINSGI
jgi:hypothetical protein